MTRARRPARRAVAVRFAVLCAALVSFLPGRTGALVAPSLVGFAIINGTTFGLDLALLTLLRGGLGWPVWSAVSVSYLTAFGLSFLLNRWLNFRSHSPLGRQSGMYVVAVAVNYAVLVLGVGVGLSALGVPYQLARIIAAGGEGAFMYCAMRWVVFASPRRARATVGG